LGDGGVAGGAGRGEFAGGGGGDGDVGEGFVALAARRDEEGITADDGVVGGFTLARLEDTLPEDRFGIFEVTLDEQLCFFGRGGEIEDGHLAAETMEDVITAADDAAGGVEDKFAMRIFFERGEDFVEGGDFFAEIFRFAFGVGGTVGPTHPRGDTVDALIAAGLEDGGEPRFDRIVAADGGTTERSEIFGPVGFTGAGHTDESEAEGFVGVGEHEEAIVAWYVVNREPRVVERTDRTCQDAEVEILRRKKPASR
jgi:hypothetical protein